MTLAEIETLCNFLSADKMIVKLFIIIVHVHLCEKLLLETFSVV